MSRAAIQSSSARSRPRAASCRRFDIPPLRGAELAVDDINAAGGVLGRPLEIRVIDYHSKPEDAGPAAQELIDDGASLIIAACDFDLGSPAALVAQDANVLAMSDCAGSVQFGVQGIGPLAYTMGNAGRSEGAIMAEWAYTEKEMTKAWTLRDTNLLYYSEVCTGFKDRFTELGGTIWRIRRRFGRFRRRCRFQ